MLVNEAMADQDMKQVDDDDDGEIDSTALDPPEATEAPTPSKLLTVPREIRNQIYRYLSHDVYFKWVPGIEGIKISVLIRDAPLSSIFRVHPRIYEEYLQEGTYNLSMSLTFRNRSRGTGEQTPLEFGYPTPNAVKTPYRDMGGRKRLLSYTQSNRIGTIAVKHARHILLRVMYTAARDLTDWNQLPIDRLLRRISSVATNLKSYNFLIQCGVYSGGRDNDGLYLDDPEGLDAQVSSSNFLPHPDRFQAGLPLVQRGAGYCLQLACARSTIISANTDQESKYYMWKIGAYTYAKAGGVPGLYTLNKQVVEEEAFAIDNLFNRGRHNARAEELRRHVQGWTVWTGDDAWESAFAL